MSSVLFNANPLRQNKLCKHHLDATCIRKQIAHSVLLIAITSLAVISFQFTFTDSARAQGTGLRPPITLPSNGNTNNTVNSTLIRPTTQSTQLQTTTIQKPLASQTIQTSQQAVNLTRFQTLKVNGKVVDLRNLSNNDVLVGKNGKSISVARIKQLQARLSGNTNVGRSAKPMVIAKQGQTIRSFSNESADTIIRLPNSRQVRAKDLAKVQTVLNRLAVKRIVKPIPTSMNNAQAQAVVGQNISLADALKRPGTDIIQIGSRKYSVDQLRFIDSQLKASKFDPRGLSDRIGKGRNTNLNNGVRPNNPATPRSSLNGGGVK